jgi:hypothetical protein
MNAAQNQIFALFQALPPEEQQDLLPRLIQTVDEAPNEDNLTAAEIDAIDEGLAQMRRGEFIESDELFDRLAKKLGFERA